MSAIIRHRWHCFLFTAFCNLALTNVAAVLGQSEATGEEAESVYPGLAIYTSQCAHCHGEVGQGAEDGSDEPLYGNHSVKVLTGIIERTMPEEDPEACVGDEARQVAEYIYDAFYSLAARQRNGLVPTPRVTLSRLTVSQYRNSVADLIGRFTPEPRRRRGRRTKDDGGDEPNSTASMAKAGLRAEYFQSKGMSKADKLRLERVDRRIDFDFGEGSPAEDITADQFAIIWQGTLRVDHTGYHEFRATTPNGVRLYLNVDRMERRRKLRDDSSVAGQAALIDGWVSSGEMREHTARVFLLGGREYPLRLEFFKYKEKVASIKCEWKPPHGTWATIDHRYLRTKPSPRTFVVSTPFPADDRSLGYERGSSVSREWHTATSNAAIAAADEIVERLPLLAAADDEAENYEESIKDFIARFASVAFRRPLSDAEIEILHTAPFEDAPNSDTAVRRAVLTVLNSPYFLYPDLTPSAAPSQHTVAARLALTLWDSIPDQELTDAAQNGDLATIAQVEAQARRMLADSRAQAKIRAFFHHWLEMEERDLAKDKKIFPDFEESVVADLRYSLESFVENIVWSEPSDYRQLLLADYLVLNDRLRSLYPAPPERESDETLKAQQFAEDEGAGPDVASDETSAEASPESLESTPMSNADFTQVSFPPERRAGVLTHPYLLSAFAYHNNTSPIHRGVFLTRNIVGRELKPPPVAVAFKNDEFDPQLTMREKVTQLTRDSACMSCHSIINPLGFVLENFDAVGRWRTVEADKPINTESEYKTVEGTTLQIRGARDVADYAVASEAAHRAFVAQLFHHLVKQDAAAYGTDTLNQLRQTFADDEYNMRNLMSRIAVLTALHGTTDS